MLKNGWTRKFHDMCIILHFQKLETIILLASHHSQNLPAMQETQVWSLGQEDPVEKGMATHSSILAQRIGWTEECGELRSLGSKRVGHNWVTNTHSLIILNHTIACFRQATLAKYFPNTFLPLCFVYFMLEILKHLHVWICSLSFRRSPVSSIRSSWYS